jgi:short-subunit dehydrogenase
VLNTFIYEESKNMISVAKNRFVNKVVLITGASSGIGEALALELSHAGCHLVLTARRKEKLQEIASLCEERGASSTLVIAADVGNKGECYSLIEKTITKYDRLDILINNAGYAVSSELQNVSDISLFENVMDVNFRGAMWCTHAALPHLKESRGSICGISSVAGFFSMRGASSYNASKFAMRGFFDALRQELKGHGVSVTMIYPGYVTTNFKSRVQDEKGTERGQKANAFYKPHMMSAQKCAQITLNAIAKRKRQVVMTIAVNLARWAQLLIPGIIDDIVSKVSQSNK